MIVVDSVTHKGVSGEILCREAPSVTERATNLLEGQRPEGSDRVSSDA